ncbi:3-methyl-2-oxobutanoate hydroxymethyltransferase [Kribbella sp. VKM Ac-2568]|uniref:3-methyl-2-oxobutanoate hydroxymethyltransferase n=1 Tax=Kribbella sp. VKM Ac-2568 TaxID=2512219 RepID=UPI001F53E6BA
MVDIFLSAGTNGDADDEMPAPYGTGPKNRTTEEHHRSEYGYAEPDRSGDGWRDRSTALDGLDPSPSLPNAPRSYERGPVPQQPYVPKPPFLPGPPPEPEYPPAGGYQQGYGEPSYGEPSDREQYREPSYDESPFAPRPSYEEPTQERPLQERALRERAAQERAAQERAVQERAAQERAARERAAQERAAQERAVQERAARERAAQERAAQDRAAQERATQERVSQERAAQERAAQERLAQQEQSPFRTQPQQNPFAPGQPQNRPGAAGPAGPTPAGGPAQPGGQAQAGGPGQGPRPGAPSASGTSAAGNGVTPHGSSNGWSNATPGSSQSNGLSSSTPPPPPVQPGANPSANGLGSHGLGSNNLSSNGLSSRGPGSNGLTSNGLTSNGPGSNGLSSGLGSEDLGSGGSNGLASGPASGGPQSKASNGTTPPGPTQPTAGNPASNGRASSAPSSSAPSSSAPSSSAASSGPANAPTAGGSGSDAPANPNAPATGGPGATRTGPSTQDPTGWTGPAPTPGSTPLSAAASAANGYPSDPSAEYESNAPVSASPTSSEQRPAGGRRRAGVQQDAPSQVSQDLTGSRRAARRAQPSASTPGTVTNSTGSTGASATTGASGGTPTDAGKRPRRYRIHHLRDMKNRGEKWAMLTAYDQYTAEIFDESGIPVLLVGDSAANNVFGYESTLRVTVDELIPLARAVAGAVERALVVADLPFGSYQASPEQAFHTAVRFMKEAGVHAVKLEGGRTVVPAVEKLTQAGIPVMAHIGFTPQSEHSIGGYRVQGRGDQAAGLIDDAVALAEAGAFSVVLEMVPGDVAAEITKRIPVPTIGIGAGRDTDAQVLVWQDMAGLRSGPMPRFVKQYADLRGILTTAATTYAAEVANGTFPTDDHTF